jgi:hypothetical protein
MGAKVDGIAAVSRTAGTAAVAAASGAWLARIAEPPTKAPPARDPMASMTAATIHIGYLLIRFIFFILFDN